VHDVDVSAVDLKVPAGHVVQEPEPEKEHEGVPDLQPVQKPMSVVEPGE